jgi:antitoxin (DNA-binding transcriptional repressor) of toxin-antitoxin stability system
MKVTVAEARKQLSYLLDLVAVGGKVVIIRRGKAIARLMRIPDATSPERKFMLGSAEGEFSVPDDFNDPLPKEIEDLFYK